jgi:hypothetical protein
LQYPYVNPGSYPALVSDIRIGTCLYSIDLSKSKGKPKLRCIKKTFLSYCASEMQQSQIILILRSLLIEAAQPKQRYLANDVSPSAHFPQPIPAAARTFDKHELC